MAASPEKLKAEAQAKLTGGWLVFHASPAPSPVGELVGMYRAHRHIENGTLVEVFGTTPEELADAAAAYDRDHARTEQPEERVERLVEQEQRAAEIAAEARPTTEEELAELAIEVQPVALAEKVAVDGEDSVTDEEKAKAGLTDSGQPKKGTHASIIPPGATPESAAAVTGVAPKQTKKGK